MTTRYITEQELHPSAEQIRREIRQTRRKLISRVVLTFLGWWAVVIVLALAMGARW